MYVKKDIASKYYGITTRMLIKGAKDGTLDSKMFGTSRVWAIPDDVNIDNMMAKKQEEVISGNILEKDKATKELDSANKYQEVYIKSLELQKRVVLLEADITDIKALPEIMANAKTYQAREAELSRKEEENININQSAIKAIEAREKAINTLEKAIEAREKAVDTKEKKLQQKETEIATATESFSSDREEFIEQVLKENYYKISKDAKVKLRAKIINSGLHKELEKIEKKIGEIDF